MKRCKKILDTSDELLLQRWHHGIRLIRPFESQSESAYPCVSSMLNMPFNVYFINNFSVIQNINERTVKSCGFTSKKYAIGKTSYVAATKATADFEFRHDQSVMNSRKMQALDEYYVRLDGIGMDALSIKFPWYGYENTLIGVFGCTLILNGPGACALAESLSLLTEAGLLSLPAKIMQYQHTHLPKSLGTNTYLTQRENEIMKLLIRGKTAKEIANILHRSKRTIEHHLENLKHKLGAKSKSELIDMTLNEKQ